MLNESQFKEFQNIPDEVSQNNDFTSHNDENRTPPPNLNE